MSRQGRGAGTRSAPPRHGSHPAGCSVCLPRRTSTSPARRRTFSRPSGQVIRMGDVLEGQAQKLGFRSASDLGEGGLTRSKRPPGATMAMSIAAWRKADSNRSSRGQVASREQSGRRPGTGRWSRSTRRTSTSGGPSGRIPADPRDRGISRQVSGNPRRGSSVPHLGAKPDDGLVAGGQEAPCTPVCRFLASVTLRQGCGPGSGIMLRNVVGRTESLYGPVSTVFPDSGGKDAPARVHRGFDAR